VARVKGAQTFELSQGGGDSTGLGFMNGGKARHRGEEKRKGRRLCPGSAPGKNEARLDWGEPADRQQRRQLERKGKT